MKKDILEELLKLSQEGHHCPYNKCCEYEHYNQCFNHSHVLCPNFEEWYNSDKEKRKEE